MKGCSGGFKGKEKKQLNLIVKIEMYLLKNDVVCKTILSSKQLLIFFIK